MKQYLKALKVIGLKMILDVLNYNNIINNGWGLICITYNLGEFKYNFPEFCRLFVQVRFLARNCL